MRGMRGTGWNILLTPRGGKGVPRIARAEGAKIFGLIKSCCRENGLRDHKFPKPPMG